MTTLAQDEALIGALDAHLRAKMAVEAGDLSTEAVVREIRTMNVLFDYCVDHGMSWLSDDLLGWASIRVREILCAA